MNRQKIVETCTTPKAQGALISAPFWIGTTLLLQNDAFAAWAWMNITVVVCLIACIALLAWGLRKYPIHRKLSPSRPQTQENSHDVPLSHPARSAARRHLWR